MAFRSHVNRRRRTKPCLTCLVTFDVSELLTASGRTLRLCGECTGRFRVNGFALERQRWAVA